MARSTCTSCGLRSQHCQCRRDATAVENTNGDDGERAFKLTRTTFWVIYLFTFLASVLLCIFFLILVFFQYHWICHVEVFVDSISVSNASPANATADWTVGFVTTNRGNACKTSLQTIKSRLLRGNKLISESSTPDYFGRLVTAKINEPFPFAVFKTVATPEGIVWDHRVEVVSSVTITDRTYCPFESQRHQGFLILTCGDIPVNFTADSTGNLVESLLGNKRPCEYEFRKEYTNTSF